MQSMPSENLEDMVTSTPVPNANQDHDFQTPRRGVVFSRSSGSSSKNGRRSRLVRTSSEISRTPSSSGGPRVNPFDSHLSVDKLHLPTCSPSVFSIVVSPSQENSSNSGGKFWSLDQQARLFPAHISDDSPWKQEAAVSRIDQEDKTQEAIDLYFKSHHNITTPEDVPLMTAKSFQERSRLMESMGTSPNLTASEPQQQQQQPPSQEVMGEEKDNSTNAGSSTNVSYDQGQHCRSTQTCLSFPVMLPPDVEHLLSKYGLIDENLEKGIKTLAPSSIAWGSRRNSGNIVESGNISNSTLRRKLFAGMIPDDEAIADSDEDDITGDINMRVLASDSGGNKENCESTAMVISPGKIMMTPNAQRIPSPNRSLSWSLSPVSRKKRPNSRTTPLGSSTPSKS